MDPTAELICQLGASVIWDIIILVPLMKASA